MTNASCTLTPAPVMRCGCIGALILSATGRAHISGEYTRPIVPPLSGFARKHPSQQSTTLAPGGGKPGCLLLSNKGEFSLLRRARTCLLCFKTQTCVLLSSRQTTGGPWGLSKEAETSRPAPQFHQKKQKKNKKQEPPDPRCMGFCALPWDATLRGASATRRVSPAGPIGQSYGRAVTAADGVPGIIQDVRYIPGGGGDGGA